MKKCDLSKSIILLKRFINGFSLCKELMWTIEVKAGRIWLSKACMFGYVTIDLMEGKQPAVVKLLKISVTKDCW